MFIGSFLLKTTCLWEYLILTNIPVLICTDKYVYGNIQISRGGWNTIIINKVNSPHCCVCPMPGLGFPTSYVVVFFMFNNLRWYVIVRFVDIGGIVDHQCLNCLFIKHTCLNMQYGYKIPPQKVKMTMHIYLLWNNNNKNHKKLKEIYII